MNQPNASILLHVQRTTVEDAFIAVPVSADLLNAQPDGTGRIDGERLLQAAMALAQDPRVSWRTESSETAPHPVQQPLPDDRKSFNPLFG